ncbi:MAG TPA: hypothetical protein VLH08_04830 [Acidobacteriota bacterium]|nr:hypothetical protein [Acidobacteriota bacterium]
MNKRFTFLAFLFVALFAAVAFAQSGQQPPQDQQLPEPQQQPADQQQQQAAPTTQIQQITGVIQKIDPVKRTITIKDEASKTTQDVDFNETTTFSKSGQSATANDLKKGDKVTLEVDSQNMVTRISIVTDEVAPPEENKQ